MGATVALLFAIGLLASGLASSSVGAYAGAMIMQGLLRVSFPLLLRRPEFSPRFCGATRATCANCSAVGSPTLSPSVAL